MKQSNGKRKSPSVERQLALALVAVLADFNRDLALEDLEAIRTGSLTAAREVLNTHGYENLESIPARIKRIEAEIKAATDAGEWGKLAKLGTEMIRAEKGLPPLTIEKKPRKPRAKKETPESAPKERKPRKKKAVDPVLQDDRKPESADSADTISCSNCEWKGKAEVGVPCPVCGYLLK